jgi:hypothetical protein
MANAPRHAPSGPPSPPSTNVSPRQPEPKPSRPEAVQRLVNIALYGIETAERS